MAKALVRDLIIDQHGNAYSGVQVDVYEVGTTTHISDTLYADAAGSTVLTNPFTTTVDGEVTFYLTTPKRVDVKYTTSQGQTQTNTVDVFPPADELATDVGAEAATRAAADSALDGRLSTVETTFTKSFNGRTGIVTPQQSDYDSFFATDSDLTTHSAKRAHGETSADAAPVTPSSPDQNGLVVISPDSTWGAASAYGSGQAIVVFKETGTRSAQDSTGSVLFRVDNTGGVGITGGLHIATGLRQRAGYAPTQAVWIQQYIDVVGVVHQQVASQTKDMVWWEDSAANKLLRFTAAGEMVLGTSFATGSPPAMQTVYSPGASFKSQINLNSTGGDEGGFIAGLGAAELVIGGGVKMTGSATFTARNTAAAQVVILGSAIALQADSGLTAGNTYTPTTRLTIAPTAVTFADAVNIVLNTSTGTKIGTATGQKLGFWNATPIIQPTTSVSAATFVANSGTAVNDASTFDGYTMKQVVKALRNVGLLA